MLEVVLLYASIFAHLGILLLMGVGVLWSPIAAGTSAVIARRRDLGTKRYAVTGGVYSALLFLPWLYMLLKMLNVTVSRGPILLAYTTVCAAWFIGTIVGGLIWIDIGSASTTLGYESTSLLGRFPSIAYTVVVINLVTWLLSVGWLGWWRSSPRGCSADSKPAHHSIVSTLGYMMPFGLAPFWAALLAVFIFL